MTEKPITEGIISDANVLIDYVESTPDILRLIGTHIQKLYVPIPILKEVTQLNIEDAQKLGIEIVEPTLSQIIEVVQVRTENPALSGQDAICYIMARDNGWICLTNDKPLRSLCSSKKILCIWGLEIMLSLVSAKILPADKAYEIANTIHLNNKCITPEILNRFKNKLVL